MIREAHNIEQGEYCEASSLTQLCYSGISNHSFIIKHSFSDDSTSNSS